MQPKQVRIILIVVIIVLALGIAIVSIKNTNTLGNNDVVVPTLEPTQKVVDLPKEQTLEGKVICLPHKDTNGPQTLECAYGLRADDGKNYALDSGTGNPPPYNTGQHIRVNGTVTPIEALSSDHWQKYDIVGIFSIKE